MTNLRIAIVLALFSCTKSEISPVKIPEVKPPVVKVNDTIYVYASGGQSNMNGWTKQAFPYPSVTNDVPGIKMFDWPTRTMKTFNYLTSSGGENSSTGYWSADHIVYKFIYDSIYKGSKEVIAFKVTKKGSGLHPSNSGYGSWSTSDSVPLGVPRMMDTLRNRFKDFKALFTSPVKVKYFLWHQGESDYNVTQGYSYRLKTTFDSIRAVFGNPDLVIIIGTVARSSRFYSASIRTQTLKIISDNPTLYRLVDLYDLPVGTDKIHFDASGQTEFAKRIIPFVR